MKHPQSSPEVDKDACADLAECADCADDHLLKILQNQGHVLEERLNFLGWVKIKRSFVVNPGESLEVGLILSD